MGKVISLKYKLEIKNQEQLDIAINVAKNNYRRNLMKPFACKTKCQVIYIDFKNKRKAS